MKEFVKKHRREITTGLFVVMLMLPVVVIYRTAATVEIVGTIENIDENGNLWIRAHIDGLDFKRTDMVGWEIRIVLRCLDISGRLYENDAPAVFL